MDNFYIITNVDKDPGLKISRQISEYIEKSGRNCILSKMDETGHILPGTVPKDIECGIVIGGDGTLIRAAREMKDFCIPFLGINLGTLGYLQEVEFKDYKPALDRVFASKYYIEERMMIKGTVKGGAEDTALNDIVVAKYNTMHILHFDLYVNGEHLNRYRADGVIVSAPTGTTGYNLSAGGPIVAPTARMMIVTPICPHSFNKSSIVLCDDNRIDIVIREGMNGENEGAAVTFDGTAVVPLCPEAAVHIESARETFRLIRISRKSFLKTMCDKMKESRGMNICPQ